MVMVTTAITEPVPVTVIMVTTAITEHGPATVIVHARVLVRLLVVVPALARVPWALLRLEGS